MLEYDGTSWRAIATPHSHIVRAMAKGPDGRIFVGEVGDFGYLQPDQTGAMKFVSLLAFVPQEERDFQDIRGIHVAPEGIYFLARERLFRLTPDGQGWRTKVWRPTKPFATSYYIFGTLYVSVAGEGLARLTNDVLQPLVLPGLGDQSNANNRTAAMLPYAQANDQSVRQMLVGNRGGQLFLLDDQGNRPTLTPFVTDAAPLFQRHGLATSPQSAARLSDGTMGFSTASGGFLILERNGKMRRYLDRTAGILSDGVIIAPPAFCRTE